MNWEIFLGSVLGVVVLVMSISALLWPFFVLRTLRKIEKNTRSLREEEDEPKKKSKPRDKKK